MKARVAKVTAQCRLEILEEEIRLPGEGELLVKVEACGLCHSDMPYYRGLRMSLPMSGTTGSFPYPIGHELSGIVEAVGPGVSAFREGDRVGGLVFGSFATHVICRPGRIGVIPADVPSDTAVLAEPLMCITNILRAANPEIGDYVGVVGTGFMGLLVIAGLGHFPVREVIAVDLADERLQLAQRMGATRIVNPQKQDVAAAVMEITGGHGVDVAIDITGRYSGLAVATKIVRRHRGKIIAPSFYTEPEVLDIGPELVAKCPIIHSTHTTYSADYLRDMSTGLWVAGKGILPAGELITHRFKFEEITTAFDTLMRNPPGFIKGIVLMA